MNPAFSSSPLTPMSPSKQSVIDILLFLTWFAVTRLSRPHDDSAMHAISMRGEVFHIHLVLIFAGPYKSNQFFWYQKLRGQTIPTLRALLQCIANGYPLRTTSTTPIRSISRRTWTMSSMKYQLWPVWSDVASRIQWCHKLQDACKLLKRYFHKFKILVRYNLYSRFIDLYMYMNKSSGNPESDHLI